MAKAASVRLQKRAKCAESQAPCSESGGRLFLFRFLSRRINGENRRKGRACILHRRPSQRSGLMSDNRSGADYEHERPVRPTTSRSIRKERADPKVPQAAAPSSETQFDEG